MSSYRTLKRPLSPSSYCSTRSVDQPAHRDGEWPDSTDLHPIRQVEALEAELCENDLLARQAEGRNDQVDGGRLIRLDERDTKADAEERSVWVERYDARLLLSPPPSRSLEPKVVTPPPLSPTGYSDLPSDHEEMFYFEPHERQEIAQQKLRRRRDDERQVRMKLREEEDRQREEQLRLSRIPPADQIELMSRTLQALNSSPAPSLLEIRILANHGNDPRFASFLRKDGQWRSYWEAMKAGKTDAELSLESLKEPKPVVSKTNSLHGLADYGDSSEDDEKYVSGTQADEKPVPADKSSELAIISHANERKKRDSEDHASQPEESAASVSPCLDSPSSKRDTQRTDAANQSDSPAVAGFQIVDDILKESTKVDPAEQVKRQERARKWAEQRKKAGSATVTGPA